MISIHDIPLLKAYKLKASLPKDTNAQNMYSLVFSNNNSIEATGRLMNHPLVYTNYKFLHYYMEAKYKEKFKTSTVIRNILGERDGYYEAIKSLAKINCVKLFNQARNRNIYYDMMYFNKLFYENVQNVQYIKKCEMYIQFFNKIINNDIFNAYKFKTVFIDVESWFKDKHEDAILNNPISMILYVMRKNYKIFSQLGDINIIFYSNKFLLRLNASKCDKNMYNYFKRELKKLTNDINVPEDEIFDEMVVKQEMREEIKSELGNKMNFISNDLSDKSEDQELTEEEKEQEELLKAVHDIKIEKNVPNNTKSLKRDEELKEKQKQIKLGEYTIEDYKKMIDNIAEIEVNDISDKISTLNENVKNVTFSNFEKTYNEKVMKRDFVNIITDLNNKSIPMYVRDIKVEDTSDELNYKDTYTINFEDSNRVRHTLTFDMPKFIDDKFLFIRGNKKFVMKQLYLKPIVKTGPDEVQICTNYNKIFVKRYGEKISPRIEKLKKALMSNTALDMKIKTGDNTNVNNAFRTTIDYDDLAKSILSITTPKGEILFNQETVKEKLGNKKIPKDTFCIGFYSDKTPILINLETDGEVDTDRDIVDIILDISSDKFNVVFDESSTGGKRFMYTYGVVMNKKKIPIVILAGYCEGLTTVLKKANVNHYFTDKRPKLSSNQHYIQFSDGYLVYDRYPMENSLLLNALEGYPTRAYNYEDFDTKDPYMDFFETKFSARNLGPAFDNYYDFMIDSISREVLEELGYPTDFVGVLLYANALLTDNSYINETDISLYRVRSNEIINGLLHKEISKAYRRYAMTASNKTPMKMSMPKDALIKSILASPSIEEYSVLNPIYELEKLRSATPKGFNGMNVDEAYTFDKRSYHPSMLGTIAMSTPTDGNVGVVRKLTLEPNIVSARGYIKVEENIDNLTDTQLFSPSELLTPNSASKDDSTRTAMATKQSSHIIPVKKSSPVLLSNGVEKAIHYNLSSDFVICAKDDGEVVEIDEDTGLVIVKYKSGECQSIDTKPRVAKNSASGFYISNKLNCNLKKGQKVKKNDILASDSKFFTDDGFNGNRFNIGSMQKVAIMSSYSTYEDSAFITKKMSKDLSSDVVIMKDVVLGKNANVGKMVKEGDTVNVGDLLISFESSHDDPSINKFLDSLGDDIADDIKSITSVPIKSKIAGTIETIKIYSTVDLDELSPSLKKIVSQYYAKINKKKRVLSKYDKSEGVVKAGTLLTEATTKLTPSSDGKIKGKEVFDGVLIEFYIRYTDELKKGDKITYFSALKSIAGELIKEGYEPYSEFRPEEEISSFVGPSAVLARQTPSIIFTMFGNKVLVELKRKLEEIYKK